MEIFVWESRFVCVVGEAKVSKRLAKKTSKIY